MTAFGGCARAKSSEPFFHHWQEVHRQLRVSWSPAASRAGDGDDDDNDNSNGEAQQEAQQCGLPEGFYESSEAHSLGLWLLGGETTVAERRLLVEEPDSAALSALLVRRSLDAAASAGAAVPVA